MIIRATTLFLLAISFALSAMAQLTLPTDEPIIAPKRPAISSDGTKIAFVYRGDIWLVASTGGRATRLTTHEQMDTLPVFSYDGKWIAFASMRNGNYDIFVMPAEGGNPTQITFSGWDEVPSDWAPDGKHIIFNATRDGYNPALFRVDVKTLRFDRISEDMRWQNYPSFSPDGSKIAYARHGYPWTRPRYTGSAAAQLWVLDLKNNKKSEISNNGRQHLWPKFLPDNKTIVCVATAESTPSASNLNEPPVKYQDSPSKTPNIWSFTLDGKKKRLTRFIGGSVAWLSVAKKSGDMVFEYEAQLWVMKKGNLEPAPIQIFAQSDDTVNMIKREVLTSNVSELEISPDGKTLLFGCANELWTLPVEKPKRMNPDDAKRITDFAGYDGDFWWSKDSKKAFFISDRNHQLGLYQYDFEKEAVSALWTPEGDLYNPHLTPDGKNIAVWRTSVDPGLYLVPLEGGEPTKLISAPGTGTWGRGGREYAFSPDGKWLAYVVREEYDVINIYIKPVEGGEAINVTKLNANHSQPRWSPDGKYLFFESDRSGAGLYILPLVKEETPATELELKLTPKPEKGEVVFEIDFNQIDRRIRKHSNQRPDADLTISPDGTLYFLSGGAIYSTSFDGKDTKKLAGDNIQIFRIAPDAKSIYFIKSGQIFSMNMSGGNQTQIKFNAVYLRDIQEERKAAFYQYWRTLNRSFYDPNFHGRDWAAIRDRYFKRLSSVAVNEEFSSLLNQMVGELEASHTEVSPADRADGPVTPYLGFHFDYAWNGEGLRVLAVPDEAPGSYAKLKINPGEYVLEINGKPIQRDEKLFQWLNELNEKDIELLVNDKPTKEGARKIMYKAMTATQWWNLNSEKKYYQAKERVDALSNNEIAYVYISRMSDDELKKFNQVFYDAIKDKKAVIIDVRNNGGGHIAETLINWLSTRPFAKAKVRDSHVQNIPWRSWDRPIAVLINESSSSNAEMFPYFVKQTGVGKIFGMPTPGYVISTLDFTLVDGTKARLPGSGVYRFDGTCMENNGEKPDVLIPITTEQFLAGEDPQLDAAIQWLMKK